MRKIKFLALTISIIIVLNIVIPGFSLAINEVNTQIQTNSDNIADDNSEKSLVEKQDIEENKENEIINESRGEREQIDKENEKDNLTKGVEETIEEDNLTGEIEETIEEEFSIYIMDGENKINPYKKGGKYYIFVPKSIDLSEMKINYTGSIESVDNATFDKTARKIIGDFQNESSFTINLKDGQAKNITVMQSDVPAIFVNLNSGITLETVNGGSKSTKYGGSVNVTGCENSKDNILQSDIEFKGRGNTTWFMPKRAYQIKLSKKTNFLGIRKFKREKMGTNCKLSRSYIIKK